MIALHAMVAHVSAEGEPAPYACVDCAAAALPASSALRAAYEAFQRAAAPTRRRALRNPLAAARLVARTLNCARAPSAGPAWGIVRTEPVVDMVRAGLGRGVVHVAPFDTFAVRTASGHWWARSPSGVARVHPSRVVAAWEIR